MRSHFLLPSLLMPRFHHPTPEWSFSTMCPWKIAGILQRAAQPSSSRLPRDDKALCEKGYVKSMVMGTRPSSADPADAPGGRNPTHDGRDPGDLDRRRPL